MNAGTAAGWYGKLPALGDFAQRRLSHDWVSRWDAWLAQGLQGLQQSDDWLQAYLAAPAWRFALLPGALGDGGASGLSVGAMVPSVDRVGRYFPLVMVATDLELPQGLSQAQALWSWAGQLEDLAVAALHQDWTPDQVEAALLAQPLPCSMAQSSDPFSQQLGHQAAQVLAQAWQGRSLWFRGHEPEPALSQAGLPQAAAFRTLFTPLTEPLA